MHPRFAIRNARDERGSALVEAALITPLLLLLMVGIFEVARAYQTFQVLTNAAREGARAAIVPSGDEATAEALVRQYMENGQLSEAARADVQVDRAANIVVNGTAMGATLVTLDYPFEFMVLQPVARLVVKNSAAGEAITMRAVSLMRNEAQ